MLLVELVRKNFHFRFAPRALAGERTQVLEFFESGTVDRFIHGLLLPKDTLNHQEHNAGFLFGQDIPKTKSGAHGGILLDNCARKCYSIAAIQGSFLLRKTQRGRRAWKETLKCFGRCSQCGEPEKAGIHPEPGEFLMKADGEKQKVEKNYDV